MQIKYQTKIIQNQNQIFVFIILRLQNIINSSISCHNSIQSMKLVNSKQTALQKDINNQLRQIRKQKYQQNLEQKKIFQHLIQNNIELDLKKPQQSRILTNGIPEIYRELVWPQLLKNNHGITIKTYHILLKKVIKVIQQIQQLNKNQQLQQLQLIKSKSEGYAPSQQLNLNLQKISKWIQTIKMDIPRTFSQLKIFQFTQVNKNHMDGKMLNEINNTQTQLSQTMIVEQISPSNPINNQSRCLFNLLTCWFMYRDDIGYKQGMSQIAGYLLIQLNNQLKAFQIFCSLITTDVIYEFFTMNLQYISGFCKRISFRLRQRNQQLYDFFDSNQLDFKLFVLEWIYNLFTRCFQLDTIGKVWDILLLHTMEEKILVNLCVEIICAFEEEIYGFRKNNEDFDPMSICRFLKKAKVDQIRETQILKNLKEIKS